MTFPPLLAVPLAMTPVFLIERAAQVVFRRVLKAHPGLFERLGEYRSRHYAFAPTDLPIAFLVKPARPEITVFRAGAVPKADAAIAGPFFLLLALLEGRFDADALFFSRELAVSGDMEAMLALRNALDDSHIDLPADLGAAAGPLGGIVSRAAQHARTKILEEAGSWN